MADKALTKEQQKLVEDNHGLIYSFLQSRNLPFDEFYDLAAIGLCAAASGFDPTKGYEFSTYAYKAMASRISVEFRQKRNLRAVPEDKLMYYQAPITSGEWEDFSRWIPCSKGRTDLDALAEIMFEEYIETIPPKAKDILLLSKQGYPHKEIHAKIGCSPQYVSLVRNNFRKYVMQN